MEYFGCAILGKKLVFCLLTEFSTEIRIPVHSNCVKPLLLNVEELKNVLG